MKKLLWAVVLSALPVIANANCDPHGKFDLKACGNDAASTKSSHQPRTEKHDDAPAEKDYLAGKACDFDQYLRRNVDCMFEYYSKAAEKGYAPAQTALAVDIYLEGPYGMRDFKKAFYWMEKAAAQGDAVAQAKMGNFYFSSLKQVVTREVVVEQDYNQARRWYEKAAKQGHALAQYRLGYLYHQGFSVKQNKSKAEHWYKKAAEQGLAAAHAKLDELTGTPPQQPQPQQYIFNPSPFIQANCVKRNPIDGTPIYLYGPTTCIGCPCAF